MPYSPPVANPWTSRHQISRIGAATPMLARRHQRHDQRTGGHQRHTEYRAARRSACRANRTANHDPKPGEGNSEVRADIDRRVAIGPDQSTWSSKYGRTRCRRRRRALSTRLPDDPRISSKWLDGSRPDPRDGGAMEMYRGVPWRDSHCRHDSPDRRRTRPCRDCAWSVLDSAVMVTSPRRRRGCRPMPPLAQSTLLKCLRGIDQ